MFQLLVHIISLLPFIIAPSSYQLIYIHYCFIAITSASSLLVLHHSSSKHPTLTITTSLSSLLHLITGLNQHRTFITIASGTIALSEPDQHHQLPDMVSLYKNNYHHSIGDIMQSMSKQLQKKHCHPIISHL